MLSFFEPARFPLSSGPQWVETEQRPRPTARGAFVMTRAVPSSPLAFAEASIALQHPTKEKRDTSSGNPFFFFFAKGPRVDACTVRPPEKGGPT